jgi:thermosome
MAGLGGQPILILRQDTRRERGRDALANNIMAARAVAGIVQSTLGPKGMDKMLVDSVGEITVTNDGVTILREMEIEHPAAKMVVEAAKTQNKEVGDGTTTVTILTGELLKNAEELMDQGIHPTMIISGYRIAAEKAIEILDSLVINISDEDRDILEKIAKTAMLGKGAESSADKLAKFAVDIVLSVVEDTNGKKVADLDAIKVETRVGEGIEDSELIKGILIDKDRVHINMPKKIEEAKILLLSAPIEVRDTETKAEISITSSDQFKLFMDQEKEMTKEVVDKIISSGANVVFCKKGIDDVAQHLLSKAGVMALRRVKSTDLKRLSRATGGTIVTNLDEISSGDLGKADLVEERKVGGGAMTYVLGCVNPSSVSLLLRAGTDQVLKNIERALDDALHVVAAAIEDQKLVAGGGAPEAELFLRLKEFAATLKGREQLAVEKFAEAMEIVPKALAENGGFDPIDKLVEIKSRHEHNEKNVGLNATTGELVDMLQIGVVEPLRVKTQAIQSAAEASAMILRVDDVIASARMTDEDLEAQRMAAGMGGGGMPPGCGMPPGMM